MTIFNGKIHYKWPFSIAMLNYQRVGSDRKCGILGLFTCLFTCFNSEIAGDVLLEVVRNACSFIFDMLMC